jgi:hypothetical protein
MAAGQRDNYSINSRYLDFLLVNRTILIAYKEIKQGYNNYDNYKPILIYY